ncbi:hypothetical protein ACFCWD_27025 [Streptomyces sp. NPDC056374]
MAAMSLLMQPGPQPAATVPPQTNPGGHELVVFVGMAATVRTPPLGTPRT